MISLRLTDGRIVDLHGRLTDVQDEDGRRFAVWEERLHSSRRVASGNEQSEPAVKHAHSAILYEVEPDVWAYPHGTGWPSFLPEPAFT